MLLGLGVWSTWLHFGWYGMGVSDPAVPYQSLASAIITAVLKDEMVYKSYCSPFDVTNVALDIYISLGLVLVLEKLKASLDCPPRDGFLVTTYRLTSEPYVTRRYAEVLWAVPGVQLTSSVGMGAVY